MSHPIEVGTTDQILTFTAYLSDGTIKTDLVAADITAIVIKRVGSTDITGTGSESDKASPNTTHSEWAIYGFGNGVYTVDAPDAVCAAYVPEVEVYGTWTDGSDSGYFVGDPYPLTDGYAWSTFGATILNRIGAFTGTGVNTILGFFKAIMFSDATEPSDAGDTFAASLEEVKAVSGSVTVTPIAISAEQRGAPRDIHLKQGEVRTIGPLAITDSNGAALDVSGKTLRVIIERRGVDLQVVENASITVSGDDSNQISFANSADVSANLGSFPWAVWDVTSAEPENGNHGEWLGGGSVIVERAPRKDV